ncbi:MAG: hypothetical protein KAI25_01035, partial [Hyphomicrobiaceae bacterium]|nr:hypothetical protein [Hyphomicrobiaceae bacterium]
MEYLMSSQDESDRLYQSLLDVSNVAWPDPDRAVLAIRGRSKSMNVVRVLNIRIKLETKPA